MSIRFQGLAAILAALVFCGGLGVVQAADRPLEIYFIDVMGGAATLLVTPERESLLIDSGWPGREDRDPKRIEHVLKKLAGLDHLDHLATTHWHGDHYGGVAGLAPAGVRIDRYWDRGLPNPAPPPMATWPPIPDGSRANDLSPIAYRRGV